MHLISCFVKVNERLNCHRSVRECTPVQYSHCNVPWKLKCKCN